ncbi:B-box zinc finger domain-containing protein [Besnoitia besnoiti]|uniref:B-box zinc finger domain-containing protein n=1 Tax=Besnoitia besnoiti TaxID=94643 RepID=A0A2A9MLQ2_BESBE|nr:B-box zinc finger domain-containing protein [Besnoitia besnoiti]PFH36410.1 B-box zinc finger domain-containing protein [Besnoitia besnoiti]
MAAAASSSPDVWSRGAVASLSEAAHPTEDRPGRVNVSVLEDLRTLAHWEYWVQLSLFTADLHIVGGWSLATYAEEQIFETKARALKGPVVYSFLDLNELETPQSLEDILAEKRVKSDWRKQIFPTGQCRPPVGFEGNPSGTFRLIVCKLALGTVISKDREPGETGDANFKTCDIPGDFTALSRRDLDVRDKGGNCREGSGAYRVLYRVKRAEQVLPAVVLEFEMKPLRIQVLQPVCELCEVLPATIYCPADRAQLCDECDERVHSATRMLSRHVRVPATHSPFQFGFCPYHPSEMIDCVCMTCFVALCPHCILIGSHSSADFSEHPLISTVDAYKMVMQDASPSEEAIRERRRRIDRELVEKHRQLSQLHSNFVSVQKRIDEATRNLIGQLSTLKERKTNYLLAIKRELLSEMLVIEWMEAFFAHLRLSLNPADFLSYKHKFDLTAANIFGGTVRVDVDLDAMPGWMSEKFVLKGSFSVTTASYTVPSLTTFDKPADPRLMKVFLARASYKSGKGRMILSGAERQADEEESPDKLPEEGEEEEEEEPDVVHAQWVNLPSEVEGLEPEGRVRAHTKMICFPEDSRKHIDLSKKGNEGPSAAVLEYQPSSEDAAPDRRFLPPQIRDVLSRAREEDEREAGLPTLMQILNPRRKVPKEVSRRLWYLLSDNHFLPLLTLLKAADSDRRPGLVAAACNMAHLFSAIPDLARHLFRYELEWVGHLPASLLLHTSSLLFPFLSYLTSSRELLLSGDVAWLHQLIDPVLAAAESSVEADHLSVEQILAEPPARLFRAAGQLFLERLQRLSLADFPCTFRGLLYLLADAVDAHVAESTGGSVLPHPRVAAPAVATCSEAVLTCFFGNFILQHAKQIVQPPDGYQPPYLEQERRRYARGEGGGGDSILAFERERTEVAGLRRMRESVERSRLPPVYSAVDKMLRQMASFCWDAVRVETRRAGASAESDDLARNPEERFLVQAGKQIVAWCGSQLRLPRLQSPLQFSKASLQNAADAGVGDILKFVLEIDREMREGTFRVGSPGLTERDVTTPAYEEILEFAIKASTYEENVAGRLRLT